MTDSFDIDRARAETRACGDVVHFNNAGSSLMPAPVADYLRGFIDKEEMLGGYETADAEAEALDNFYGACGRLLNCGADEIAYAANATRAWDMAFYGMTFKAGDRILTTMSEYGSNVIAYNHQVQKTGAELVFVPDDEYGQIDIQALENLVDEKTRLISISLIPTGGGLVNPAAAVGKIANQAGVPYLLDACQAVGHIPLDVEAIGCDMLSGTGRKYLRGPRATGMLYIKQSMMEQIAPPFLDQHSADLITPTEYKLLADAKRYENWEQYFGGKAGLGVAIDYAMEFGLPEIQQRIYSLADSLRSKLAEIDSVTLTDLGKEKCGIVTFTATQKNCSEIKKGLAARQINVTVSDGSGSLVSFQPRGLTEVMRASVHYFNTEQEVDYFIDTLKQVLS